MCSSLLGRAFNQKHTGPNMPPLPCMAHIAVWRSAWGGQIGNASTTFQPHEMSTSPEGPQFASERQVGLNRHAYIIGLFSIIFSIARSSSSTPYRVDGILFSIHTTPIETSSFAMHGGSFRGLCNGLHSDSGHKKLQTKRQREESSTHEQLILHSFFRLKAQL